jgi:hypothetical protein
MPSITHHRHTVNPNIANNFMSKPLAIFALTLYNYLYWGGIAMSLGFMSTKEAAELWGLSMRRVQVLCDNGQIEGAQKFSDVWLIPKNTKKPIDGRTKEAKKQKNGHAAN